MGAGGGERLWGHLNFGCRLASSFTEKPQLLSEDC